MEGLDDLVFDPWSGVDCGSQTQEKDELSVDQSVYAVMSLDQFMLLRTENDYSIAILHQLETAASLLLQQVGA